MEGRGNYLLLGAYSRVVRGHSVAKGGTRMLRVEYYVATLVAVRTRCVFSAGM